MSLSTTTNKTEFIGNGTAGPFTFNFKFFANSDISVVVNGTTMAEGVDYTLNGAGNVNGGSITLTAPLLTGTTMVVRRTVALTQPVSLPVNGPFFADVIEKEFDRLTMMIQQLATRVDEVYQAAISAVRIAVQAGAPLTQTIITADASSLPVTVDLIGLSAVFVSKDDASSNEVTILDSSGATVIRQSSHVLYQQDEGVSLIKIGANWKRID